MLGFAFFVFSLRVFEKPAAARPLSASAHLPGSLHRDFWLLQYTAFDAVRGLFPYMYSRSEIPIIEEWQAQGRMVANWVHPSDFGSLLNIVGPLVLYSALKDRKTRLAPLLVFVLIAFGIFLTATRTPIIAFCLSNTLLYVLVRRRMVGLLMLTLALSLLLLAAPLASISLQRFKFSRSGKSRNCGPT